MSAAGVPSEGQDDSNSTSDRIEGAVSPPAPKRRRVGLACSACRIRKSRCNGVRPKCDPCDRLGFECIYELPDASANLLVPRDIFATLETKVKLLEATVQQQDQRIKAIETSNVRNDRHVELPVARHEAPAPGPGMATGVIVHPEGIEDAPTEQSMTDGMALSFVNEEDCGFFGPSSNIAFMRHIFRAMSKKGITSQGRSPDSPLNIGAYQASMISVPQPVSSLSVQEQNGELENAVQANILPPEEETEKLIRSYFSNTGLLFPFIHEDTFLATYNRMRDQHYRANIRRTWLGLLNMIVAMAICTSQWAEDGTEYRTDQSDVYYRRARELCKTQMMRGTTLETVQYLLLTSQYLQGTQRSVQTWTTHGLAVKAALSIGLHSRDVMARFTPIEQEMRKRTWFGCVLLDRSLSMTFGRPGAIPEEYIQLDLPTIIPLDNGTEATLLYRVLWKIVATLYGHNLASVETPPETWMITQIFQLEQELNNWASALPSPLFLRSSTNLPEEGDVQDDVLERFRVVLSLRYLSVQLLLYRPVLADSLARGTSGEKQRSVSKVQANFNFMCVQVAEDIINIIHAVLTKPGLGRHLMGAWWFTLYYTFNAALVLFGSLLVPIQDTANDPFGVGEINRTKQYLEKAVQGLVQLGTRNITLHRCVDYLKQLVGLLDSWGSSPPLHLDGPGSNNLSSNAAQDANLLSDLLSRPPALEGPGMGFEDDLELGNFFTSEFQRWFDRFPT
ncbi:unnamed protein product [Clonostachys rhizophaga]|uniref:Zn(2)-C6 fungal-type domain-containing protein n=1 Tax=Clonostachys rhizophaga TaxID=160324 RepID=A0A9N9VEF3_9HYPO|nr:unnamed protein product [Clonostachys rhizophaga]